MDIPVMTELEVQESDFSPAGKETFRQIISEANVVRFKTDCRDLGPKYVHTRIGGTSPPVPNETRCCQRDGHIVKQLSTPGIIRKEPRAVTNSSIQAVKKSESRRRMETGKELQSSRDCHRD